MDYDRRHVVESMLQQMLFIRLFEESVEQDALQGMVQGGVHLSIGQEAVAVGVHHALQSQDYVTGGHRGHHICLARGMDPRIMMAELMGKATGLSRGKSGSMHLIDPDHGILGLNGIVAASIGIATGAAFAVKYWQRSDQVVVGFFGDGAGNKGLFNESLNLAGLWNLPVIYVCENNQYAVETHVRQSTAGGDLSHRAEGYGFPGITVDGMDPLAVWEAVTQARTRAVNGEGPTLIEAQTYRYRGHDVGDPQTYRTKDEIADWRERDPIEYLTQMAMANEWLDGNTITALRESMQREVDAARRFALESPDPELGVALQYVYSQGGTGWQN
ncbi:MAG: pyruvate dehydrogenase (acetyl-transferring) E1 component subunit alpha [Sulfobacillus acidophilus]|uniref:Pyruvate dehydrogenase (Acetyl-transferring) E1 component subunit alpha n=1 Tax=Sulfobacillus acidophilus TaxID=53633 RepID=A0A2T2WHH9_9FIRM|nr:MAG: pyruvate dehydrogenase (acetyl-transferring) E1 component subunit alpha [Sulfobacillus acidophilus]